MSKLLCFDWSAAIRPNTGLQASEIARLTPVLDKLRDEICEIDEKMLAGEIPIPASKAPLLGAFHRLPERALAAYEADRTASELARLLAVTKKLMTEVDRVVVLCDSDFEFGARAVMEACCQPFFNQLSRGQRGSRPRLYVVSNCLDNDFAQGLLHLLGSHHGRAASSVEDRWGLVLISNDRVGGAVAAAVGPCLAALKQNCGSDQALVRSRLVAVGGSGSWLVRNATQLGCNEVFELPNGLGARCSVMSAAGLIPAALLGVNIMKLQEGARTINEQFRASKASENMVLQVAAVNHLMANKHSGYTRVLNLWNQALEATGSWYERLVAGCLDGAECVQRPVVHVAMGKPYAWQRGRRFLTNVSVKHFRFDPLVWDANLVSDVGVAMPETRTLVELTSVRMAEFADQLSEANEPSVHLELPCLDEDGLGQLLQTLMLATVVEARLLGLNPYSL